MQNTVSMAIDMAGLLFRNSVGALSSERARCSACKRTPLAGELLHELSEGPLLCALCLGRLPEDERRPVRSERVHVSERQLAVRPAA